MVMTMFLAMMAMVSATTTASPMDVCWDNGVACDKCMQVYTQLQRLLEDETTYGQLLATLEAACQYFPSETREMCRVAVDTVFPLLATRVTETSADQFCHWLHVCRNEGTMTCSELRQVDVMLSAMERMVVVS